MLPLPAVVLKLSGPVVEYSVEGFYCVGFSGDFDEFYGAKRTIVMEKNGLRVSPSS